MEIIHENNPKALEQAVNIIKSGGIVIYPTDTAYGVGVDALNKEAVTKLYDLKGREEKRPTHVVVADIAMANRYVEVPSSARKIATELLPGALTLVLKDRGRVAKELLGDGDTLGVRIPDYTFALDLSREANTPITTPSANRSGFGAPYSVQDVVDSFMGQTEGIDLIVDAGVLPKVEPSTFVDFTHTPPAILREGPVSGAEIKRVLG